MCYPVVDPKLPSRDLYGAIFQCRRCPEPDAMLEQLLLLVQLAKKMSASITGAALKEISARILKTFSLIFQYLSGKTSDFNKNSLAALRRVNFIPLLNDDGVVDWFRPDQVFFKTGEGDSDSLTEMLFKAIEFSSFLSAVGVKEEASAKDLFILLIQQPESILEKLGEKKYVLLLRRLAANPPFSRVSPQIRKAPFLLAYTQPTDSDENEKKQNYELACAEDIVSTTPSFFSLSFLPFLTTCFSFPRAHQYIIDNSFFGRMFPVLRAPHESDLEDFYVQIGSQFISSSVHKRFEIVGRAQKSTNLAKALRERIEERTPLLVSPYVTSRPLVPHAASVLEGNRLTIFESDGLLAVYTLGKAERRQRTTCCARPLDKKHHAMYVTKDFDFFDVGQSIGDLILERCQLEDAFFISSLLDTSLEQLRSRGFPVDRVLKPKPLPEPPKPPPPTPPPPPPATAPTIASIPPVAATAAAVAPPANQPNTSKSIPDDDTETVNTAASSTADEGDSVFSTEEIMTMVKQMFPDADEDFLKKQLGKSPALGDVQQLAEEMAKGNYPRKTEQNNTLQPMAAAAAREEQQALMPAPPAEKIPKRKSVKKALGRAFGGFRGGGASHSGASHSGSTGADAGGESQMGPATSGGTAPSNDTGPVSPQQDAASYSNMTNMLQNQARNSAPVDAKGITSNDTVMTSVPKDLDRGSTCEVVPGQSLKPFPGPRGDGRTHNGVAVFSARKSPESEVFLQSHEDAVEKFALVLTRLAEVYEVDKKSIAIFHDPCGGTIAFNSNRSLHFNVRYFHALHYLQNKHDSFESYSYWFTVVAHEVSPTSTSTKPGDVFSKLTLYL